MRSLTAGDAGEERPFLYAGLYNDTGAGASVWQYDGLDGGSWSEVGVEGFGDVNNTAVNALAIYNSLDGGTENPASGGESWSGGAGDAPAGVPEFNMVTLAVVIAASIGAIFIVHRYVLRPQQARARVNRS